MTYTTSGPEYLTTGGRCKFFKALLPLVTMLEMSVHQLGSPADP